MTSRFIMSLVSPTGMLHLEILLPLKATRMQASTAIHEQARYETEFCRAE